MLRIMLATVCCRFGSRGLFIKLDFVQTLSTRFGQDFELKLRQDFEAGVWFSLSGPLWQKRRNIKSDCIVTIVNIVSTVNIVNIANIINAANIINNVNIVKIASSRASIASTFDILILEQK